MRYGTLWAATSVNVSPGLYAPKCLTTVYVTALP
jgi:hypothetical protein